MQVGADILLLACLLQPCFGRDIAARAAPAPVVVSASQYFEGNDGPWSSFELRVGTPAQNIRVFPGTSSTSTLVVLPQGCLSGTPGDCANARGGLFNISASTTWSNIGLYELGFENNLGFTDAGQFGNDAVGLGYQGSGGPTVNHSVVAGIAGTEFYLGVLGLNPRPTNFTSLNEPQPSFMTVLKNQSHIPSLSYSYTAGAPYRLNKALGSLVLGGYDISRFQDTNSSYPFFSDQTRDLTVGLSSITTNITGTETSLLPSGTINTFIDSSVPEIYLPTAACQAFETAFNLTYNSTAGLYLVNDTLHQQLISENPSITFTITTAVTGGPGFNVTLPYAAFDLTATYPLVSNNSRYFPLQRAANDTQYTLGKTFLQEAYLIVDYERSNFSVHPCVWNASAVSNVVAIVPPSSSATTTAAVIPSLVPQPGSNSISGGAIAGIVIGVLFVVTIVVGGLWWFLVIIPRRQKRSEQNDRETSSQDPNVGELEGGTKLVQEIEGGSKALQEAEGGAVPPERKVEELEHRPAIPEMPARPPELGGSEIHEMPGSEVPEMPAASD